MGGGECSGDAGGVWNRSSSSLMRSIKGRGDGASVMRSSRLRGELLGGEVVVARLREVGLGGSGVYPSINGDEIVVGGVVVMFSERMRIVSSQLDTAVFKSSRRLIAVGCSW